MSEHKESSLSKNAFVILIESKFEIQKNSIGIVKEILSKDIRSVFFYGTRKEIEISITDIEAIDIRKTGKPKTGDHYEFKICNVCHILKKNSTDFERNQNDAKGRATTRPSCRSCRKLIDGAKLKSSEKKRLEESKPEYYFVCPICEKGSIPGVTANLVKDHDHVTGNAREWLCDSCNTGLGRFKDDIALLQKAIRYLEGHIKSSN